jgi:hypothetical protein
MLPRKAAAFVLAVLALAGVSAGRAQETTATPASPTTEQMIEVAREAYRPPGLRKRCPQPTSADEIVVCAPDSREFRVSSPTDDAIAADQPVPDGLPRAPDVFGLPPCKAYAFCAKIGRTPEPPLLIDLEALPEALTPEEAALVFRAEDQPDAADVAVSPATASPAAAP